MVNLTINGKTIQAEKGSTILEVAREAGIDIPTLCYHEALSPYGACRVCIVEIFQREKSSLVASCLYPVDEGIIVKTDSKKAIKARKTAVELLLASAPNVEAIRDLAQKMGIEKSRFPEEDNECILCGLCVRTCEEIVGVNAINFSNRGINRKVDTPFNEPSTTCIGCGSCVAICPTGAIKMEDHGNTRLIRNWKVELELQKCKVCNNYFAAKFHLDYLQKRLGLPKDIFELCPDCME